MLLKMNHVNHFLKFYRIIQNKKETNKPLFIKLENNYLIAGNKNYREYFWN